MSRPRASRSCGNCRAVKRRCDQQIPSCGQCIRQREKCPGYRDEWALVFRDQTDHTIKRSKAKRAQSAASAVASSNNRSDGTRLPTRTFSPSMDDIGVNYFLRNFVSGGQSSCRGYFNYLPSVYHGDGVQPTLVASMAAVGLVALANATQQPELAGHACAKYTEAIHNVNSALASPVESVKDSTLMSVISLGLFEQGSGFEPWVRHVQGAAALVVARGKAQFSSPVAIRLFNQVRLDLVVACLHGTKPFPADLLELQEEAARHTDVSSAFWLLGVLGPRVANLLLGVRTNTGDTPWSDFLDEAIAIERELHYTLETLAVEEPYTTTRDPSGDPDIIYNGRLDLYRDFWAIRLWNNSRNLHMVVCEILCFLLGQVLATGLALPAREHMKGKLQDTMQTLSKLGDEVLATVPQALEFVSAEVVSEARRSVGLSVHGGVSGGYMLTWCLYMVGKSMITKKETRRWIIRRLQDIGTSAGVSMALQLVDDIVKIDEWAS